MMIWLLACIAKIQKMPNSWLPTEMLFSHIKLPIKGYKSVNDYDIYK